MMWLYLVLVVGTTSVNAFAGSDINYEQIRQLVKQGKILSLDSILQKYPQLMSGRLLDLEVEFEHGMMMYELEFLQQNGDVIEFKIDAANGEILEQEVER